MLPTLTALTHALRGLLEVLVRHGDAVRYRSAYTTQSLDLLLDLADPTGERAVLTRRQRVVFTPSAERVVRELVWGEGQQLGRYQARGADRIGVRPAGSRAAVLLRPHASRTRSGVVTMSSRRLIRHGFRASNEYCEALLERPAGPIRFTVLFPRTRPPRQAELVLAASETVLRTVPVRYRADGRAVLRCCLTRPRPAALYSLRWSW